jgi:hypothetical protein
VASRTRFTLNRMEEGIDEIKNYTGLSRRSTAAWANRRTGFGGDLHCDQLFRRWHQHDRCAAAVLLQEHWMPVDATLAYSTTTRTLDQ